MVIDATGLVAYHSVILSSAATPAHAFMNKGVTVTQTHGLHVNPRHALISQFNSFPISLRLSCSYDKRLPCAKQRNFVHVDDVVDEACQPEGQSNVAAGV